jgi:F-type H+-transporting ATPase subunit gamma
MASTRELRRRIRSIGATSQITRAMQMVAASKMRKAQQAAVSLQPFMRLLYRIQREATMHARDFEHQLLATRPVTKRAVILVAADKGLCGALNSNVFRLAGRYDPKSTEFITAGRKASQFVARTRRQLVAEFPYGDTPRFDEARAIARMACNLFLKREVDEVRIVATRFVNTLTQQPIDIEFLPIGEIKGLKIPGADAAEAALATDTKPFLFEPGPEYILGFLLPRFLDILVYAVLLNAKASEQSARMVSMKSATDNAETMIKDLTLHYNKLRQGHITEELLEIQGGQSQ